MKKINIQIDKKRISCEEGENVLQVALKNGIDIPHFCYHEDLPVDAHCRTCLVEDLETKQVVTSCSLKTKKGLKVSTKSAKVNKLRKENLELLLADHLKRCPRCKKKHFCKNAELMKKFKVTGKKYKKKKLNIPVHKLSTAAELDANTCISCNKCVEMCKEIGINFLKLEGKGANKHITYNKDPKVDCMYCGQCTVHCPVSAAREQSHIEKVEEALKDKNKIVIAQMAPSVRASIGEEFGLEPGSNMTGKMYAALRKMGFDKIFDVNMGADITTWVEAEELVERIKNNGVLPMFTSCCPGWVKYAEFYHPEILPNLTTSRSPQIHSGAIYKTWWAEKEGIDPKDIVVVSFMPCTSKKYEASHKKLNIGKLKPVDYVLTTRETGILLKKLKIDLPKLKPEKVDKYGQYTGAATIYGATGGVMESALRTAYHFLTGKELKNIDFKKVRGMEGIKEAKIKWGKVTLSIAVIYFAKNAHKIIEYVKKHPKKYHYIEVMACPGGCIGGGGQPIPSTEEIISKRIDALYKLDKSMKLRKAHKNPIVIDLFENYLEKIPKRKKRALLYTTYKRKKKFQ